MSPLVSLVITTYNGENYLSRAIESILTQSYTDFELVIWDDGSGDRSVTLAQYYAQQDPRVKVVAVPRRGPMTALQTAIAQTTGAYLGWVNSDDWLHPSALTQTVAALEANPQAGFVYTDYLEVDAAGQPLGDGWCCATPSSPDRWLVDCMTVHFRLLRRTVFEQVGGIRPGYASVADDDLCLRLSEVAPVAHVAQPLYFHRQHPESCAEPQAEGQFSLAQQAIADVLVRCGLTPPYRLKTDWGNRQMRLQSRFATTISNSALTRLNVRLFRWKPCSTPVPITAVLTSLLGLSLAQLAQAQSITPGAGSSTQVLPNGNQYTITGGQLSSDQTNLFHTFNQFGLNAGEVANFLATPQLQNILGRVNGGSPSIINGLLQVTGGNPNLYLVNPAGIIFGANASLNVPAAFTATTADQVSFGDRWWSATGINDNVILNGNPDGFAFSSLQPGVILNAGDLAVTSGHSLTLLGGTVVNTGTLTAPGGQITIAAVPGANRVRLSQAESLLNLEFSPIPATDTLSAPSLPQLLTGGSLPTATGVSVNPDGSMRLTSTGTVISTEAGNTLVAGNIDASGETGGSINLLGQQIGVVGATIDATGNRGGGTIRIGGDYRGEGRLPNARLTVVDSTTTILANGGIRGDGGRIIIWADDTTRFYGTLSAQGGSFSGNGGFAEVSGKETLTYRGQADLTAIAGITGTLLLDPSFLRIIDAPAGSGDLDGALPSITAATPDAVANTVSWGTIAASGANVTLEAIGDITFDTITSNTPLITFGGTARLDLGATGVLTIRSTAGNVIFADPTNTIATNGGSILVQGNNLTLGNLDTRLIILPSTQGGNITLSATGNVTVGNIDASAGNALAGNGGAIAITAGGNVITQDLTSNANNFTVGTSQAGSVAITSTAGSITVGNILLERSASSPTDVIGGSVTLETLSNGGNIAFGSIQARGLGPTGVGGSASIIARGEIRGTNTLTSIPGGLTIALQGDGGAGRLTLQHDGSATNLSDFVIGGAVTPLVGNGTTGGIQVTPGAVPDLVPTQVLGFASSPFTAAGGNIQITYANAAPLLTGTGSPPPVQTGQTLSFNLADLGVAVTDPNADTNLSLQVGAIAPGAVLTINGVAATTGSLIPAGAQFEFTPPPGFVGNLAAGFEIVASDLLQTSLPLAVPIQVQAAPPPPPPPPEPSPLSLPTCIFSDCTTVNLPAPPTPLKTVAFSPYPTFEERFTRQLEGYLGLPNTQIRSTDAAQDIARRIQREVGVRPAFIYVGFVPATISPEPVASQTKELAPIQFEERPDDQLEVVLVTPIGTPVRKRIPEATREKVLATAATFRIEVSDPRKTRSTSYLPSAQQLYRWILTPIEPDLQERGIENLVFLMDLGLRSLPISALHSGDGFLIERYSVGLMPSLSLTDTVYQDIRNSQVLGMGITSSTGGQSPLPGVFTEVNTLVNRLWAGRLALNESVTPANLQALRQQQPFGIVHLATHADFRPGSLDASYIQFWDQRLNLNQMRNLGLNSPQVELIVLSACTTAIGDQNAELGFSGMAVQIGVKSAVASLWYVNDASAVALITGFYKQLQTARIKAEALRQIQLSMARGDVRLEGDRIVGLGIEGDVTLPAESLGLRDQDFSHPYYWSGFTLVGNPW
jgi:filamentous hemagglutinin family protein